LRGPNVEGTQELLRIVAGAGSGGLHYVSTTGVYAPTAPGTSVITESTPTGPVHDLPDGYSQSKWVAEGIVELARRRGLPVTVYRPARISGDSRTGACQELDLLWQFIKGCLQAGAVPQESDESTGWVPVDHVSAAVVALAGLRDGALGAGQPADGPTVYHLTNPQAPRLSQSSSGVPGSRTSRTTPLSSSWAAGPVRRGAPPGGCSTPASPAGRRPWPACTLRSSPRRPCGGISATSSRPASCRVPAGREQSAQRSPHGRLSRDRAPAHWGAVAVSGRRAGQPRVTSRVW